MSEASQSPTPSLPSSSSAAAGLPINVIPEPPPDNVSDAGSSGSEWEQLPPGLMDPPAAAPTPLNLSKAAEDASVLLELFSKTKPANNKDISREQRVMINTALEGIKKIHRELRVLAAESEGTDDGGEAEVDTMVDAACIICYTDIADTVVLPCGHLILCRVRLDILVAYGCALSSEMLIFRLGLLRQAGGSGEECARAKDCAMPNM